MLSQKNSIRIGDVFVALARMRAIKFSQTAWEWIEKAHMRVEVISNNPRLADYVDFYIDRGESCMILKPPGPDILTDNMVTTSGHVRVLCRGQVVMVSGYQLANMFAQLHL